MLPDRGADVCLSHALAPHNLVLKLSLMQDHCGVEIHDDAHRAPVLALPGRGLDMPTRPLQAKGSVPSSR